MAGDTLMWYGHEVSVPEAAHAMNAWISVVVILAGSKASRAITEGSNLMGPRLKTRGSEAIRAEGGLCAFERHAGCYAGSESWS